MGESQRQTLTRKISLP